MAWLAKPSNHRATLRKIEDWRTLRDGRPLPNGRTKLQVQNGIEDVGRGLQKAWRAGNIFDEMCFDLGRRVDGRAAADYGQTVRSSLGGDQADASTEWESFWSRWRPVAHAAAAFRATMYKHKRGLLVSEVRSADWADKFLQILQDPGWLTDFFEAHDGRLAVAAEHRVQFPRRSIFFVPAPQLAKMTPHPES